MPIKDRDGNVYRLSGPNPAMKNQDLWDKNKLVLINMHFEDEVTDDAGKVVIRDIIRERAPVKKEQIENVLKLEPEPIVEIKPIAPEIIDPKTVEVQELQIPTIEMPQEIKEEPTLIIEPPKETIKPPKPKSDLSRTSGEQPSLYNEDQLKRMRERTIKIHCLPIYDRKVVDDIYGDNYNIRSYGDKFTFEGIIVEEEDLYCQFWTTTKIPERSIVYPKNHSRRWWKVESLEEIDGGYMIYAVITYENPDFTD